MLEISGAGRKEAEAQAMELLELMGLSGRAASYPRNCPGARNSA